MRRHKIHGTWVLAATAAGSARILRASADLARAVTSGAKHFDVAVREAQEAASANRGDEALNRRLRDEAPDLAALVNEARLRLHEAIGALDDRQKLRAARRSDARILVENPARLYDF